MNQQRTKIALWLVIVCLVWGSTWLAIKVGLDTVPPLLAAGLRFALASVVLFILLLLRKETLPRGAFFQGLSVFMALTAFSVPYALVYWGQRLIPSALSSILFASYPFFVAIFSHAMLPDEKMNRLKVFAVLLGFAGVYVIFSGELVASAHIAVGGMLAIVLSALIQAVSLVVLKKYGNAFSTVSINFVSMSIGALLLLAASVWLEDYSAVVFTPTAVYSIVYLALFGNVVAFVAYFWLVKHIEAVLLSMTSFVTPIISVILGAVVLSESLSSRMMWGAALVLCGILAANGKDLAKLLAGGKALLWD